MNENIPDWLKAKIEDASAKEEIYPKKYGSGSRQGYDTMMLYEINSERSECFEKGAYFGYELGATEALRKEKVAAKSFLLVLQDNWQAQIAGFYNDDKTDEARKTRTAVIEEYEDLIQIYKRHLIEPYQRVDKEKVGGVWVKASERSPTKESYYFSYRHDDKCYPQVTFWYKDKGWSSTTFEWLDESQPEQNPEVLNQQGDAVGKEAIEFGNFIQSYESKPDDLSDSDHFILVDGDWYWNSDLEGSYRLTTEQLYNQWVEIKKDKV